MSEPRPSDSSEPYDQAALDAEFERIVADFDKDATPPREGWVTRPTTFPRPIKGPGVNPAPTSSAGPSEADSSRAQNDAFPSEGSLPPESPREPDTVREPTQVEDSLFPGGPVPWRVHLAPEEEPHFEPPTQIRLTQDPVYWAMVASLVGGPLWFLYLVVTHPSTSTLQLWAAALITVSGLGLLVRRLPRRGEQDPDDDGARV